MKNVNIFLVIVTVVFLSVATGCGKNPVACADCTQSTNTPVVHNNATATATNVVVVNATATATQTSTTVVTVPTATATFTSTSVAIASPTATTCTYYVTIASAATPQVESNFTAYVGGHCAGSCTESPYSILSAYSYVWTSDVVDVPVGAFHMECTCPSPVIVTAYRNGQVIMTSSVVPANTQFWFNE
jgi:hypothetical protein